MRNVKGHVPVDPPLAEYRPQPASAVWAADANLAAAVQNSLNVHQHLSRIENVFQNIRKHGGIETVCWVKFPQRASMDAEPSLARFRSRSFVEFESFCLESIAGIDSEVAPLVAADIEQPPGAPQKINANAPFHAGPTAVQERNNKTLPQTSGDTVLLSARIVMTFVHT